MSRPRVAVFRPDDGRLRRAVERLDALGVDAVADALLSVEPTGADPRSDADFIVLTSAAGVGLLPDDWRPGEAVVCAIGEATAAALEATGVPADVVPETYSSAGLVEALADRVDGARVEVLRSDHGSAVLRDGLDEAGAYHHETVLYRLARPDTAGRSATVAAEGGLDGALFTSSLTVTHFLESAEDRGVRRDAIDGLDRAVVGAIGEPTRRTAEAAGIGVDVVPETASFAALARAVVERLGPRPADPHR